MANFAQILEMWLGTLYWVVGLSLGFGILSRYMPCNPGMYWWKDKRAVMTDIIYWFVVPIFLHVMRILMLLCFAALVFGAEKGASVASNTMSGYPPLGDLPVWQQAILVLVIEDFFLYWIHRIFHSRFGWRVHAIHHSSTTLDWMSTQRFHPVNNLMAFALVDIMMLLAGFSMQAFIMLSAFNIIYSAMVHANLNWTFGLLKYVFASPVFHRWHHTAVHEGGNKNFAPTFPILDVIFGTFYMPAGKLPENYGVDDPDFPEDFLGQFIYPFKKAK